MEESGWKMSRRGFFGWMALGLVHSALKANKRTHAKSFIYPVQVHLQNGYLRIEGLVEKNLSLSVAEIQSFPKKVWVRSERSIEEWEGVHLRRLFSRLNVDPSASLVTFYGADESHKKRLSTHEAFEPDILLAYRRNGKASPLQLIIPRMEGDGGVKDVKRIVIS